MLANCYVTVNSAHCVFSTMLYCNDTHAVIVSFSYCLIYIVFCDIQSLVAACKLNLWVGLMFAPLVVPVVLMLHESQCSATLFVVI